MSKFVKMNPEVKEMWVDALRSGKYRQGEGQLRCDNEYCCLGVLTDLHRKSMKRGDNDYRWDEGYPEDKVLKWAGLPICEVDGENDVYISESQTAVMCNDGGKSFKFIANFIEKNL